MLFYNTNREKHACQISIEKRANIGTEDRA